ncbi:MAG: malate synthase G [Algicola sp.]|nr:malate synthase G [Algicola sp.]
MRIKTMNRPIDSAFFDFINETVLPLTDLNQAVFWQDLNQLLGDFAPANRKLLATRTSIQGQIDEWQAAHIGQEQDLQQYQSFLQDIGYLQNQRSDFSITTDNVDLEIATMAGPQLVVPINNARFALNAANARWGSLFDVLYGTDVIAQSEGLKVCKKHNQARGNHVISYAKTFLDETFALDHGSHVDVTSYLVYYQHLLAMFPDGSTQGLRDPGQFVALSGHKEQPTAVVLKNNGLHVVLEFDRNGSNGAKDLAGLQDIQIESALTTIMDFEDSVSAVDAQDKIEVYRHWLGLMQGNLETSFDKNGETVTRQLAKDKRFTCKDANDYDLPGRSLLMARNVGLLMETDLMLDDKGNKAPEGIIDAVVTALVGMTDLKEGRNSRTGSIYIVKPKLHGPDEVAFTCKLFSAVEDMLKLKRNTLKLGIMDEERRTTLNLKECIRVAKARVVFINTGFLDRTGDEIHTAMQAGPFLPKNQLKQQPWLNAYEQNNVDVGLACGFSGKAQIGKGMWAMPDEMAKMMTDKIEHPQSGATTAWVPSPSAAVLHALHYHKVDVFAVQQDLMHRDRAKLDDLLTLPLMSKALQDNLRPDQIEQELENNIQGILGYVVRWIDSGIGCSKVPDINNVGLMEDRATLRISSQHIANWLLHGITDETQVSSIMVRMAAVVDEQNQGVEGYQSMTTNTAESLAFQAARKLIFTGVSQPNGYTEPLLHHFRAQVKRQTLGSIPA